MASGEFCNARRRVARIFSAMYGFVIYVVATVAMVFCYPTLATPTPDTGRALVHWRADGLPRGVLVLVFHPGRRRR